MRVYIPDDSDSNYTLYTDKYGYRNGSIISFMNLVAQSMNFGLYEVNITNQENTYHSTTVTNDTADICLQGIIRIKI